MWRDYISELYRSKTSARATGMELKPFACNLFKTSSIDIKNALNVVNLKLAEKGREL